LSNQQTNNQPGDLHDLAPWFNLIRRARLAGLEVQSPGYYVIRLTVLIGPGGNPILWAQPDTTRLEPRGVVEDALGDVLKSLTRKDGE